MKKINREITKEMLNNMSASKRTVLTKALDRNEILTSARVLASATLEIYKEGFYLKLSGTRASFNIYYKDNDGELEEMRKPKNLHLLYTDWDNLNECDFYNF